MKQKQSKAIDMRFHWIHNHVRQGQFHIYWCKGILNKANYFMKHHPSQQHQAICSSNLHEPKDPSRNYFECLEDTESEENETKSQEPSPGTAPCAAFAPGVLAPHCNF
jgi:hypothetical protein